MNRTKFIHGLKKPSHAYTDMDIGSIYKPKKDAKNSRLVNQMHVSIKHDYMIVEKNPNVEGLFTIEEVDVKLPNRHYNIPIRYFLEAFEQKT